jgi:hypothetical protein
MTVFGYGQGRSGALVASAAMKAAIAGRQRGHRGPQPVAQTNAEREGAGRRRDARRKRKMIAGKRTYQPK